LSLLIVWPVINLLNLIKVNVSGRKTWFEINTNVVGSFHVWLCFVAIFEWYITRKKISHSILIVLSFNFFFKFWLGILYFTQGPSIRKKMTDLFFVYFGTHINKIHRIYKQTSVFVLVFSMLLFWFYKESRNNKKSSIYFRCQYAMLGPWMYLI
jgi:hypothetical protein